MQRNRRARKILKPKCLANKKSSTNCRSCKRYASYISPSKRVFCKDIRHLYRRRTPKTTANTRKALTRCMQLQRSELEQVQQISHAQGETVDQQNTQIESLTRRLQEFNDMVSPASKKKLGSKWDFAFACIIIVRKCNFACVFACGFACIRARVDACLCTFSCVCVHVHGCAGAHVF